jgi:hypothetical protein
MRISYILIFAECSGCKFYLQPQSEANKREARLARVAKNRWAKMIFMPVEQAGATGTVSPNAAVVW